MFPFLKPLKIAEQSGAAGEICSGWNFFLYLFTSNNCNEGEKYITLGIMNRSE